MLITLKNEFGTFEIGGGRHKCARLTDISGLGISGKEITSVVFPSQAGHTVKKFRDTERVITMSFDFYGEPYTVERLYKILYRPLDIYFNRGDGTRRKISAYMSEAGEIENIIFHKWQKIALQFICPSPYFNDEREIIKNIGGYKDNFPNAYEGTEWKVSLPAIATERVTRRNILNSGDVTVYPVFTIKNYGENSQSASHTVTVKNRTTGKSITVTAQIYSSSTVIIDVPKRKITQNGTVITDKLSNTSILSEMYLAIGENDIEILTNDANDIISMDIKYTNNYAAVII